MTPALLLMMKAQAAAWEPRQVAGAGITDVPKTVRSTSMGTDDLAGMEEEALVLRIASAIVNHASTDATESNIDLVVPGLLRLRAWSIST